MSEFWCLCTCLENTNTMGAQKKHVRGQQTPCGNFQIVSPGHQRLRRYFGRMGSWNVSECLMSRSLGVQLSGFAVVMHHFHCNMWAAHCRHPLPLVTPSWEIPQSNWATQLPANKGSKKASRMCIFSRSWGFKNIFYRRPHLNVYVLHNASRPQTVYKKRT